MSAAGIGLSIFGLMNIFLIIGIIAASIYSFILFVKLAHRKIKALDIYLEEKRKG